MLSVKVREEEEERKGVMMGEGEEDNLKVGRLAYMRSLVAQEAGGLTVSKLLKLLYSM